MRNEMSIDEPLNVDWDGNELLLSDILGSDRCCEQKYRAGGGEKPLLDCISHLTDREQFIMCLRFGINGNKEHTQRRWPTSSASRSPTYPP